jgi:hypothetical protein
VAAHPEEGRRIVNQDDDYSDILRRLCFPENANFVGDFFALAHSKVGIEPGGNLYDLFCNHVCLWGLTVPKPSLQLSGD